MQGFARPPNSRADRMAAGRAMRRAVPRSAHAAWAPGGGGRDPIAILETQNASRVPALVPIRMQRMAASPFGFLRGSAAVMASDLSTTPATGFHVMACGDMHISNFGMFASAERNLVFAINDFDEVHPGPWEWDLKRLAASAAVAALHVGGDRVDASAAAYAVAAGYRDRIGRYARMGYLDVWYDRFDEDWILSVAPPEQRRTVVAAMKKARAKGHMRALDRLTEVIDGQRRIREEPPLVVREPALPNGMPAATALELMLQGYLHSLPDDRIRLLGRYTLIDGARRVVGVGSVGTSCWMLLLRGEDLDDPLFLQIKEAGASVLSPYVKTRLPDWNHGRRVVTGQRMIQGSPDIFLGYGPHRGTTGMRDYYVRQLADMKGGLNFKEGNRETLARLPSIGALTGAALALAHAKSGSAAMIDGYIGSGDAVPDALAAFALAYADQTMADHGALLKAIRSGRIAADPQP